MQRDTHGDAHGSAQRRTRRPGMRLERRLGRRLERRLGRRLERRLGRRPERRPPLRHPPRPLRNIINGMHWTPPDPSLATHLQNAFG